MDRGDEDAVVERRISAVPTVIWLMLGALLVLGFIALVFFVFHAPPSWKADRSLGPPEPAPSAQPPAGGLSG
jgi:hypothetical protein